VCVISDECSIQDSDTDRSAKGGTQVLKGKSVLLRPFKRSDISYFLIWFNDPEIVQYLDMYLPMTEMSEEKFIEELGTTRARSDVLFVIEAIEGDSTRPIGNCGLHQINPKDHDAIFGIIIGEKDYWSKGYGVEAGRLMIHYGFQQLNLHRISSAALLPLPSTNVASSYIRSLALRKRVVCGKPCSRTGNIMTGWSLAS